jgi:hypothetical protein
MRYHLVINIEISLFIVAGRRWETGVNSAWQKAHVAKDRIVHHTPLLKLQYVLNSRTRVQ